MISYEQSIVKKIPFLLEIDQQDQALKFAINSGDPNIIDKVFSDILKKAEERNSGKDEAALRAQIAKIYQIEDAYRHLRNFAKKKKNDKLLMLM